MIIRIAMNGLIANICKNDALYSMDYPDPFIYMFGITRKITMRQKGKQLGKDGSF